MGTDSVTDAGSCGLPARKFSRVSSPMSVALDNVFKLATLFGCPKLFGCPGLASLLAVLFAVLAWPPLLPQSAEKLLLCLFSSALLAFLYYNPLSWFLHRSALDYCQAKVVLQFLRCASCVPCLLLVCGSRET